MIIKQEFKETDGAVVLRNTIDCQDAIDLTDESNKSGGARTKNMVCIGHIPPEMFMFDPWLIQARKALMEGDKAEHRKMINKFFDLNPAFKIQNSAKYFALGGAP